MKQTVRAAFYGRASTGKQEASVPAQREEVMKLAKKNGYLVVVEYVDDGISGDDTEKRVEFQRMIAAARTGEFDLILCWSQDRFGRFDPLEAGYWIKPLRDAGVVLETVAEGRIDWESFPGRIQYTVAQEGKHAFLLDLSRASARGMARKASEGRWLGGKAPYGYRLTAERKLILSDPVEVEAVQWLFTTYATTATSLGELVRVLNEQGTPSPGEVERRNGKHKGRPEGLLWCKTTIHKILTRPVYLGHTVWNRRHEGNYHGVKGTGDVVPSRKKKRAVTPNDPVDWITKENTHQRLIDQQSFDEVQRRLAANRDNSTPKRNGRVYLFTGLIYCGHCGWPMHGCALHSTDKRTGKAHVYQRYICGNYNLHGSAACRCNTIAEDAIFAVIMRKLQVAFSTPDLIAAVTAEIRRLVEAKDKIPNAELAAIESRLTELNAMIDNGTETWLAAPAELSELARKKLLEWKHERERLTAKKSASIQPSQARDVDADVKRIASRLKMLAERGHEASPAAKKEVVREMVERIDLQFKHIPYGIKRSRSVLAGGQIKLCADPFVSRPVLSGSPEITVTPARASPRAICSASRLPYVVQLREPTMATAPASASIHSPRK